MKKTIYVISMMLMMSISAFSQAEDTKVILQSGASTTIYDGTDIATAIGAAKKGDILYLSEGTYSSFTIDKEILVRGVGTNTYINGDVTIAIPNNATLTQAVLEGVNVSDKIIVSQAATDMIIRNCKMNHLNINAALTNGLIDRCWVYYNFYLNGYTNDMTVKNSKVYQLISSSITYNKCKFINCNLSCNWESRGKAAGIFENCILGGDYSYGQGFGKMEGSTLINTLIGSSYTSVGESSISTKCYFEGSVLNGLELESSIDVEAKGYFGTDGTVVGVYGGSTPFTLDPQVAKVTESTFTVDTTNKKLSVKLKVAAK